MIDLSLKCERFYLIKGIMGKRSRLVIEELSWENDFVSLKG